MSQIKYKYNGEWIDVDLSTEYQTRIVTDMGDYYTGNTVESALAQIGEELDGLADALEGLL